MIYFTSDCHFNHNNILKYEPISRPFATIEEMNETIIKNWNDRVTDEDTIYVLGDLCMGRETDIEPIINRLNGHIILVRGNHDQSKRRKIYQRCGIEIKDIDYISYKGRFFILCHFPMQNKEFAEMIVKDNSEVIWLYGHIHSNAPKGYVDGSFHVGVDTNEMRPVSIEEIWQQSWPELEPDAPVCGRMTKEEIATYKNNHDGDNNHECDI